MDSDFSEVLRNFVFNTRTFSLASLQKEKGEREEPLQKEIKTLALRLAESQSSVLSNVNQEKVWNPVLLKVKRNSHNE